MEQWGRKDRSSARPSVPLDEDPHRRCVGIDEAGKWRGERLDGRSMWHERQQRPIESSARLDAELEILLYPYEHVND